jgi:hypothetical protein
MRPGDMLGLKGANILVLEEINIGCIRRRQRAHRGVQSSLD